LLSAGGHALVYRFDYHKRWHELLRPLRDLDLSVLEIGSASGASAKAFLELLPKAKLTCVDISFGGDFDANLGPLLGRLEKIEGRSLAALEGLRANSRKFDVIYVDGSHTRDDALMDSIQSWQLLKDGGLIIWDDYVWGLGELPVEDRCKEAIDTFLDMHRHDLTVIEKGYQVYARKAGPQNGASSEFVEGFTYSRTFRNLCRFLTRKPLHRPHHGE
jgi:hypothetical protein